MTFIIYPQSKICFGCVKETSQGDVSFTHPKTYVFLWTVIQTDHKYVLLSESSVPQFYFK